MDISNTHGREECLATWDSCVHSLLRWACGVWVNGTRVFGGERCVDLPAGPGHVLDRFISWRAIHAGRRAAPAQ